MIAYAFGVTSISDTLCYGADGLEVLNWFLHGQLHDNIQRQWPNQQDYLKILLRKKSISDTNVRFRLKIILIYLLNFIYTLIYSVAIKVIIYFKIY